MLSVDQVLVTVILDSKTSVDMELPAFLPIRDLKVKMLETARQLRAAEFADVYEIDLMIKGQLLQQDSTLAASGVWDGSYVEMIRR